MTAARTAIPVLAIDGPSGSGKGTISRLVAARLGWHILDSGVLYRATALAARRAGVDLADASAVARCAAALDIRFSSSDDDAETRILLHGEDATDALRSEACGADASVVAVFPAVREALLDKQRSLRRAPGLVADGRDMGTVVFPDACCKVFLTASAAERARRRYKQLKDKGLDVTLPSLVREIEARDARDARRAVAPLRAATDAVLIDTTSLDVAAVVERVLEVVRSTRACGD